MTKNTTKNDNGSNVTQNTQSTENLFGGRKYLPDPAPPAHTPASVKQIHGLLAGGKLNGLSAGQNHEFIQT